MIGNNHGRFSGNVSLAGGCVGNAFKFPNRVAGPPIDEVLVSASPSLNPGNGSYSFEAWIKILGFPSTSLAVIQVVDHSVGFDGSYLLGVARNAVTPDGFETHLRVSIRDGTQTVIGDGVTDLDDGNFHHVAMVIDRRPGPTGNKLRGYVDHRLEIEQDIPAGFGAISPSATVRIGREFQGLIDELSFYDTFLTQQEIDAIFFAGSLGKCRPVCIAPIDDIVSWWGGDADASDQVGNNHGTVTAGVTVTPGRVRNALTFPGGSDIMLVPNGAGLAPETDLDPDAGSFSVEAWVRVTDLFAFAPMSVIEIPIGSNGSYSITLTASGVPAFQVSDDTTPGVTATAATAINDGTYHHVALVIDRDSGELRGYVDGVEEATTGIAGIGAISPDETVRIGAGFEGQIDELAVYNAALTYTETILGDIVGDIPDIIAAAGAGKCLPRGEVTVGGRSIPGYRGRFRGQRPEVI